MFMAKTTPMTSRKSRLGMDTYCLVVEPGQRTVFGGVVECELSDGRLILRLTDGAAEKTCEHLLKWALASL
jgi:hypothetical protein